jgi:Zn-dependent protease/predicted transcriptional regulator
MLRGQWRIGRIGGIEIRVDPSWAIIAALITYNFWLYFADQRQFPGATATAGALLAVLAALLFFGSILGHELAHAVTSKARGIPVLGITLFMFGGATHAKVESRGPADEFLVTIVGPGTSLALGAGFLALQGALRGIAGPQVLEMLSTLGRLNIAIGVFNLLPGFPLDGGRILRSALWKATGSLPRATQIAARVGQLMGILIALAGVAMAIRRGDPFALWLTLIGWFLFRAATETLAEGARRQLLENVTAGQVMSAPPPTVPAEMRVAEAMDRYLMGHEGEAFPVVDAEGIVGFVSLRTARAVPLDRPVRDAMVGKDGTVEASPADRMDAVVQRLAEHPGRTVLVMDGARLVGVIEPSDLTTFLRRGTAGSARRR